MGSNLNFDGGLFLFFFLRTFLSLLFALGDYKYGKLIIRLF